MEVSMVTDHQVKCLFRYYGQTGSTVFSALKSGMNRRTASKYNRKDTLPSQINRVRDWRTREDPLEKIWEKALEFLKESPGLEAKALFEHLLEQHPDQLDQTHLRAFQRPTEIYVPKNLKTKWGKRCLQRFLSSEDLFRSEIENEITPEFA